MAIPVNNKIKPPTLVTLDIYFLKLFEKEINLLIKNSRNNKSFLFRHTSKWRRDEGGRH